MILAIDYDSTYSAFPEEFDALREMFQMRGHSVFIVTARLEQNKIDADLSKFDKVVYTNGKAKASVVHADIFIDDCPITLCCDFIPNQANAIPANDLYQNYNNEKYLWHFEEDGVFRSYKQTPPKE